MTAHIDEFLEHRLQALGSASTDLIPVLMAVMPTWELPEALNHEVQITSTTGDVLGCNMTPRAIRLLAQDPLVLSIS